MYKYGQISADRTKLVGCTINIAMIVNYPAGGIIYNCVVVPIL
jgi:hypothetical protein